MKVGDLACDIATSEVVIIISKDVEWTDTDDQVHRWDFEVMTHDQTFAADAEELEKIS